MACSLIQNNVSKHQQEHQTNLSQLSEQFAVTDDDDSQRKDETGEEECDDESVVMRVTRVPVESPNQASV